jgi:hypothetical protein
MFYAFLIKVAPARYPWNTSVLKSVFKPAWRSFSPAWERIGTGWNYYRDIVLTREPNLKTNVT